MSRNYDNWERLVEATLKREQLRALARADSLDSRSSFSSIQSDLPFHSPLHRDRALSALSNARMFPSHVGESRSENLPTTPKSPNVKAFLFNKLKNATRSFRFDSYLGEGGHGTVFKGWIDGNTLTAARLGSGLAIAVKKLKPERFHGHEDWLTEVNYLGQLHHPNLVKLIGYCSCGVDRFLVQEFMLKGSLGNHLFRRPQSLLWTTRIKVAIGAARGLSFLHEADQQVMYADFKSSDILLDSKFNAKLSKFGSMKVCTAGDRTYVSAQIVGSDVYAAPEYVATGFFTEKSNVYGFGVVFLEILSGRRAWEPNQHWYERNLVDWAKPKLGDKRKVFDIMDIKLHGQYPQKTMYKAAGIALRCLNQPPKQRPHMADVLAMLQELQSPESATKIT